MTAAPSIQDLARLGCTGHVDVCGRLMHDGDTCPVHEEETIAVLNDADAAFDAGVREGIKLYAGVREGMKLYRER